MWQGPRSWHREVAFIREQGAIKHEWALGGPGRESAPRGGSQHRGWEASWLSAAGQAIVGAAARASCRLEASPGLGPE